MVFLQFVFNVHIVRTKSTDVSFSFVAITIDILTDV